MSDIARREEPGNAVDKLVQFAEVARATHGIAQSLAGTSFVPTSMKNKPDEVTGAILAGAELGLSPMAALASIDLIEGRPSVRANTMRGLLLAAGGEIELVEASDTRVVMRARLNPQRGWQEVAWTLDRARKMGLDGKANWKKMPQAMMVARATSELVRLCAAHLLIGMPYSSEELTDEVVAAALVDEKPRNERRTAQRQKLDASFEEPERSPWKPLGTTPDGGTVYGAPVGTPVPEQLPEPEPAREIEAPAEGRIADTTRKAIMAGFTELGVKDRNERLGDMSKVLERDVPSVNVLTEAEGRAVVRYLSERRRALPGDRKTTDYDWPEMAPVGGTA